MDQELDTIRLVTRRYTELQGLRFVMAGAMLAVTGAILVLTKPGQRTVMLAIIGTLTAMLPGQFLVDRYYKERFGRIVAPASRTAAFLLLGSMAAALTLTGKAFGPTQVAITFLIGAAGALWVAIRDWPLRAHHLLGCAAAAFGGTLQLLALDSASLPQAQAITFLVFGLAYIPVGLLDHRLLTSVMRTHKAALKGCATDE